MADENEVTQEEIAEAKELGWADKDAWKGDPEKWVGAKEFLERGRHILPIVQEHNKKLRGTVGSLSTRLASAEEALRSANAAIEALQESNAADVKEQVEAARKDLREQLAQASRDGDHERIAELTDSLTQLNTANADAGGDDDKGGKGGKDDKGDPPKIHPEVAKWYKDNPEFATDRRRIMLARAVAEELREEGEDAVGAAFLDLVAVEVNKTLGTPQQRRSAARAESGNGGGGRGAGGGGGSEGKTYADLPTEAKQTCERMAARLVGPNRAHKDLASWQKSYAKQYFEQK